MSESVIRNDQRKQLELEEERLIITKLFSCKKLYVTMDKAWPSGRHTLLPNFQGDLEHRDHIKRFSVIQPRAR